MLKKFKNFYAGYCDWCKEGRKHHYGDFLYLVSILPMIIYFCYTFYQLGKETEKINNWNSEIAKVNEELSRKVADKMSEDETSDN